MNVIGGADVDKTLLERLIQLDAMVYPIEQQGEIESVWGRFTKNKDTYTVVLNNDEPVGYLCAFPITDQLYHAIKSKQLLIDADISPEQIQSYIPGKSYNLYIISIVVHPQFQGSHVLKHILHGFADQLIQLKEQGVHLNLMLAHAISDKGARLLQSLGFHAVVTTDLNSAIMEAEADDVILKITNRLKNGM